MAMPYLKVYRKYLCITCLSMLTAASTLGGNLSLDDLQINGFATFSGVATNTNSDDVGYGNADRDPSFDVDSFVGLQFTLPVNDRIEFVWQPVSRAKNNWTVETEWAFSAFKVNETLKIRAGRLRIPFFRLSDSLLIGYSQLWVRPPIDMYDQFAFSRFTGIDALISLPIGDSELVIQPLYGTSSSGFEMMGQQGEFSVKNLAGVNVVWSYDWITLRIGRTEGDYDVFGAAFTGMEALADNVLATTGNKHAANQLRVKDRHGSFTGLGMDINYNNFILSV